MGVFTSMTTNLYEHTPSLTIHLHVALVNMKRGRSAAAEHPPVHQQPSARPALRSAPARGVTAPARDAGHGSSGVSTASAEDSDDHGDHDDDDEEDDEDENNAVLDEPASADRSDDSDNDADEHRNAEADDDRPPSASYEAAEQSNATHPPPAAARRSSKAPLTSSSLSSFNTSLSNTGLLYFSRLPPRLKPPKLRQLLSSYGAINRIFLTPERSHLTRARSSSRQSSASTVRRYVDGWVEFEDKRVAKAVALTLNGSTMGGRKRGYWYDDVWSVKYLPGFKWNHLTERVAYDRKLREGRRREELSRARKDSERYVQQVEKSKRIQQIQERKRKREGHAADDADDDHPRVLRTFYQRPSVASRPLDEL